MHLFFFINSQDLPFSLGPSKMLIEVISYIYVHTYISVYVYTVVRKKNLNISAFTVDENHEISITQHVVSHV
jgi:hypothetical protein